MTSTRLHTAGFTLIEVLIAVAIVAILATIAYPSYRESIARGQRAAAKAALLEDAQFLERFFTTENRYDQDHDGNPPVLPVTGAPREGTASYAVTVTHTATTFVLTATPISGGRMDGDACGDFGLNNFGQKTVAGARGVDACWNK